MPAMNRRFPDRFTRAAKAQGAPARSVFKLEEIDRRCRLLRRGQSVLELGCAPGSWTQYVAGKVGANGRVLAYDLSPLKLAFAPHVTVVQGDVFALRAGDLGRFDVVLSDMAPATMGHHKTDALRSAALAEHALGLAEQTLRTGGHVVVKVLEGGEVVDLVARMRRTYTKVERLRPEATRRESTEIFLVGLAAKPPPTEAP